MYLDIHTHHYKKNHIEVVILDPRKLPEIFPPLACLGIHPWYINEFPNPIEFLTPWFNENKFFALGEIGLDKAIEIDFNLQTQYFKKQMEFAKKLNIPRVIIHSVRSYNEIFSILKDIDYKGKILFHDFNSTIQMAQQLINYFDCYFSFGARMMKHNNKVVAILPKIPIHRIFLETDDHEDISIEEIYHHAAKSLSLELIELLEWIDSNFKNFCH